eukprot:TRINITY_DN2163_c0_g1_i1.p1 TRINITY_DN2163_c0_g1~~TRINITY_DN2163_c0_g1_i1.p1  ORF type:complete len:133 (-),score=18.74 TRINITY_DN2163_c0_g1_i1:101-478(-)
MPAEKCTKCGKTVYVVEKLTILDQVWHKWCFKCDVCNCTLNMKNYSAIGGKPYCKVHFPMPTASGTTHGQIEVAQLDPNRGAIQSAENTPQDSEPVYQQQADMGTYGEEAAYEEYAPEEEEYYEE